MANPSQSAPQNLGFCTVRSHSEHGYFGGYLILNSHARPLEFHCTLPVKPSRAQSILYGSTLPDFVCGEQIAKALVTKAKLTPQLVITDCAAVLALSHVSDQLVAWLRPKKEPLASTTIPNSAASRLIEFHIDDYTLGVLPDNSADEKRVREIWKELDATMDLHEPFERIAEALLEAHPVMKAAA